MSTHQGALDSNALRTPDDETMIASVRSALGSDARVDHASEIAVFCKDRWVVLRGTVASPRQMSIAKEIVKSVPGVGGVEVELRLDPRDRWEDGELRGTALQALIADAGVPADRIDVDVDDGWLTLKGEVKNQSASDAAFAAVSKLSGVGGITNQIRVVTAGLDG
jgi:osmotically-inducible protein OsmY